ncbi:MAG: GGDEF domain-containing phosphodiesterase [Gammaproteobacteria bacterium]|nr:GGDEF domain-containing phosphodiesterase [Gammaproteobacteria bacterium]
MYMRKEFLQHIDTLLDQSRKDGGVLAYLVIKLKRFKDINTAYSLQTGDELLLRLEKRLRKVMRPNDVLSRTGDSEFGMVLPSLNNVAHALLAANKIVHESEKPLEFDEHFIEPNIVVGVSIATEHTKHEGLIQNSTIALMEAEKNNERYRLYEPEIDRTLPPKLILENEMHYAYEHDEYSLCFQPKIDITNQCLDGAEALIRWHSSKYGLVNTQYFVDILEESTLLMPVTKWVLNMSLRKCLEFQKIVSGFKIAVNLSPALLTDNDIVDVVASAINIWNINPASLVLEVTEGAMMKNPALSMDILNKFNAIGVGVSIDDFGTGYSSLSYLKNLPARELKIDRSFVMNMLDDPRDKSIVKAAIDLAHNLDLHVVAEGIEQQGMQDSLTDMGCDYGQGYHIARPMPEDALKQWLSESHWVKRIA